ncbi:MAG TPA: pitrilysin family protein [Candidatus Dormibacteraeota bacterium]
MAAEVSHLENGLTVVTVPGMASASAVLFVGAGSRYETREVAGSAHFLEHLFFKGTHRRPSALEIASEIDSFGGMFNAFTSKEYTAYFVKSAADYVDQALDVIADMLTNALIEPDEVERERGVILQEMRMYHDQPGSWVSRLANQLLYGDTPMGWDIVGFDDVIKSVSRDQIATYREAFYAPGRMTLAVAGPVEHGRILGLAGEYFDGLGSRELAKPEPAAFADGRTVGEGRDVQQAAIHIVLPGPAIAAGEHDLMAAQLVTMILGGSMSSRLFISVRERQGLCYHISSSLHPFLDTGAITIATGVDPERAVQAVTAISRELDRLLADGVTEQELQKARAMYKSRYTISREDSMSLALGGAMDLLNWGRVRRPEEIFALVDSVSVDDLNAAARSWYATREMRLAVVGPPSVSADELLSPLEAAS